MNPFAPSLCLLDQVYVAAIILRLDGSGAYGGGTYDILGPTGTSFGYPTMAAQPGDIVEIFGVGFGPTTPTVPAGEVFSGAAPINATLSLHINHVLVTPTFVGLSSAGLYQINLIVPPFLGEGDVPIQATVGGLKTQSSVLFSLRSTLVTSTGVVPGGGTVIGTGVGVGGGFGSGGGTGGGTRGGSGGGTGGGSGEGPEVVPEAGPRRSGRSLTSQGCDSRQRSRTFSALRICSGGLIHGFREYVVVDRGRRTLAGSFRSKRTGHSADTERSSRKWSLVKSGPSTRAHPGQPFIAFWSAREIVTRCELPATAMI